MTTPAGLGLKTIDGAAARLEAMIVAAGRCPEPWLGAGLHLLLSRPGKRLRPALVFSAAICGPRNDVDNALACAASVEFMHLSSLIHDDLMDEADSRCGVPALHASVGPEAAIVGGDYLLAVGGRLAAGVSAEASIAWHEA
jgi:heptaprenyl diphosphate synthase